MLWLCLVRGWGGGCRQRWDLGQEALPYSYCYVFVDRGVMQIWVRWMLCQRGGALANVGKEPGGWGRGERKRLSVV